MHYFVSALFVLSVATCAMAYSDGAPAEVCDDMTPKHPFEPRKDKFPYTVAISKTSLASGQETDITISGKDFKGFFVQVRKGNKAVGTFTTNPKEVRGVKCHGTANSAATHSNASVKKSITLKWKAPQEKGELEVYATVAENGEIFWAKHKVGKITVK
ncbi:hypothetical protein WA026_017095 [Henosepilachna vigintioctopunctata]|uniref:Reelin domain-containing protein n=1 Tax=Henosepilachna vigintioctopunctata TaxID=420089 RepID=A0AAW1TUD6_9CUCU